MTNDKNRTDEKFLFRTFAGENDFEEMARISMEKRAAIGAEYVTTAEDYARLFKHYEHFDPKKNVVIVEHQGEVVAYGYVRWWEEDPSYNLIYRIAHFISPKWWGTELRQLVLDWSEARLIEIAKDHTPKAGQYFQCFHLDEEYDAKAVLKANGYEACRYFFEMIRANMEDIPEYPLPEGIEVHPVPEDQYRYMLQTNAEAFKDHWGNRTMTEELMKHWMVSPEFQPELFQVAWSGDEIVGMVMPFIDEKENEKFNRKRGYTEDICVVSKWRGKGIAKALISRSLKELKARGMNEAGLGVDAENSSNALALYEHMGFKIEKKTIAYRKLLTK
jgi:mycothiol synthase